MAQEGTKLKSKRWNDPREEDDGYRLLVCRFRPRGLAKAEETWDEWYPSFGPSRELHAAFYGKNGPAIGWEEYRRRYLDEIETQRTRIRGLARRVARGEKMTILCSSACVDPSHCHGRLLLELIVKEMETVGGKGA